MPGNGETLTDPRPVFDWADALDPDGDVISYTLLITGSEIFTPVLGQEVTATTL
jgi:hypothetical protein